MKKYSPSEECIVMTRDQVRSFDQWAINTLGIPGMVLMENAGRSCAELINSDLAGVLAPKVSIFCGTGNNGGDGLVIARHLLNSDFTITVTICGDRQKIKGDAKTNLDILESLGQSVNQLDLNAPDIANCVNDIAADADMVVDALFGTGLKGKLSGEYKDLIKSINTLDSPVLAVDIPSGLECDSGKPLGAAVKATCTVTFVALKEGFAASKGSVQYTGEIFIASIGVEPTDYTKKFKV